MSSTVTLDQISDFGDLIPAGKEFSAKAKKIEPKTTKPKEDGTGGDKPFLQVQFEVLEGEFEGIEFSKSYFLNISKSERNGKLYARGVLELCNDMKNIGQPLPADYRWEQSPTLKDVENVAKLIAQRIKPSVTPRIKFKSIAEVVQAKNAEGKWVDQYNEDGTKKTRPKYLIVGGAKAPNALVEQVAASVAAQQPVAQEAPADKDLALL